MSTPIPPGKPRSPWLGDLMGGITSGVVALPLALAFAIASGVEPKAGLYTAIVAGIVASLVGGAPLQITGPTGAMAVVLIGIVTQYGLPQVWVAGIMAGLIQLALGFGKLGRTVALLPLPVITGFTAGIAVIISAGQLGHALGLAAPHDVHGIVAQTAWYLAHLSLASRATVALTVGGILVNLGWSRINQTVPGSLVSLLVVTLASVWLNLDVTRIGAIPPGLPMPALPSIHWEALGGLIHPALALAALGSIESLLAATVADRIAGGTRHDPNRELVGQGLANIVVPFFGGIPCTGAIARTAVNIRAGARTRWSGVVHGVFVALVVVALGGLAAHIPLAALAGILMVVCARMVEWDQMRLIARSTKSDLTVMALTCGVTVFFDLVTAVEVGLAAAALLFIRRMADVHVIDHPEVPAGSGLPEAIANEIGVIEVDRPLFFGDAHRLEEIVLADKHRAIVIRLLTASTIDVTAAMVLADLERELSARGVRLVLSDVAPNVLRMLERLDIVEALGRENIYAHAEDAVRAIGRELQTAREAAVA